MNTTESVNDVETIHVFSILKDNYGDKSIGLIFNFCLVYDGLRKAMLLETSDSLFNEISLTDFIASLQEFILIRKLKTLDDLNIPKRIYIYNETLIGSLLTLENIYDHTLIGKILDFSCPGQLDGNISVHFYVNGYNFITEICNFPIPESIEHQINTKFLNFKTLADKLGLVITRKDIRIITHNEVSLWLDSNDYKNIFDYKTEIADIYLNVGYKITDAKLISKQSLEEMTEFIKKYKKVLQVILIYIKNNPMSILYGKIDPTVWDFTDIQIEIIEENLYSLFSITVEGGGIRKYDIYYPIMEY
jgi:hypothetical protein